VAVVGDLMPALRGLSGILHGRRFGWDLDMLNAAKESENGRLRRKASGFRMIELLREVIPEETAVVCDLNYPSYWAEYHFPVYYQHTFLMPRGISPIFYSLPAAIGAGIGRPDRPCIAFCGDGGFLPTVGELATIKKYNIPVVVFLYNNGSFGILEDIMKSTYAVEGSMELSNPDFVRLARSFGIKAKRTRTLEGLKKIFLRDITWNEPFFVEFNQPVYPPPWRA
jgi:acetolactate synthase I/II/III large subunit